MYLSRATGTPFQSFTRTQSEQADPSTIDDDNRVKSTHVHQLAK
jgi:hypothetical protein